MDDVLDCVPLKWRHKRHNSSSQVPYEGCSSHCHGYSIFSSGIFGLLLGNPSPVFGLGLLLFSCTDGLFIRRSSGKVWWKSSGLIMFIPTNSILCSISLTVEQYQVGWEQCWVAINRMGSSFIGHFSAILSCILIIFRGNFLLSAEVSSDTEILEISLDIMLPLDKWILKWKGKQILRVNEASQVSVGHKKALLCLTNLPQTQPRPSNSPLSLLKKQWKTFVLSHSPSLLQLSFLTKSPYTLSLSLCLYWSDLLSPTQYHSSFSLWKDTSSLAFKMDARMHHLHAAFNAFLMTIPPNHLEDLLRYIRDNRPPQNAQLARRSGNNRPRAEVNTDNNQGAAVPARPDARPQNSRGRRANEGRRRPLNSFIAFRSKRNHFSLWN